MQYLITLNAIETAYGGSSEQVISRAENTIIPSFKMLVDEERSNKISGGAIPGRRHLVIIADFPNHEEANRWVMSLPFFNMQTVDISPLISFQSQQDAITKRMQDIKPMQQK